MIAATLLAITKAVRPDMRPAITDPVVMAMRPQGRMLAQLYVSNTNPDADFATIHEAVAAAQVIRNNKVDSDGAPWRTWNHRVDVVIDPGVYEDDYITDFDCIAYYASDGGHSSVKIKAPTDRRTAGMSVFEPHGFTYAEGISIETRPMDDGQPGYKYPLHLGMLKVFVFTRGELIANDPNAGGSWTAIGTDGGNNAVDVLHDVILTGSTNQHGWEDEGMTYPMHTVYSKVSQTGGGLGYGAGSDIRQDHLWVTNSTTTGNIQLSGEAGLLHVAGTTAVQVLHLRDNGSSVGGATDNRSDWPIPYGGYSDYYRNTYGLPPYIGSRPWETTP